MSKVTNRPRIQTVADAERCIKAICSYLRRIDESTLAAEDLEDAVKILHSSNRSQRR